MTYQSITRSHSRARNAAAIVRYQGWRLAQPVEIFDNLRRLGQRDSRTVVGQRGNAGHRPELGQPAAVRLALDHLEGQVALVQRDLAFQQ
jgi:hypothetical protein